MLTTTTQIFNEGLSQFRDNNKIIIRDIWARLEGGNSIDDITQLLYNQYSFMSNLGSVQQNLLYAKIHTCTCEPKGPKYERFLEEMYNPFIKAFNELMGIFHKIHPTNAAVTTYNDILIKSHSIRYQDIYDLANKYYNPTLFLQVPFMDKFESTTNDIWLYGDIVGGV